MNFLASLKNLKNREKVVLCEELLSEDIEEVLPKNHGKDVDNFYKGYLKDNERDRSFIDTR